VCIVISTPPVLHRRDTPPCEAARSQRADGHLVSTRQRAAQRRVHAPILMRAPAEGAVRCRLT
jgi:hypothetical protein